MLLCEKIRQHQYEINAWFVYRYFCQNPKNLKNECYKEFYIILDTYFTNKYRLETEEKTRKGIKQLFSYESEKQIIVNKELIDWVIKSYKEDNTLLS